MTDKVYCKECAYCYRVLDNYVHMNNDDYFCCNPAVHLPVKNTSEGDPVHRPIRETLQDTTCIHINKDCKCKGFLLLQETKVIKSGWTFQA